MSGLSGRYLDTYANFKTFMTTQRGTLSKMRVGYSLDPADSTKAKQVGGWKDGWWVFDLSPSILVSTVLSDFADAQQVDSEGFSYGWVPATA